MPLNEKGEKIKKAMMQEYGSKKGEKVFYASENKGVIKGIKNKVKSNKKKKLDQATMMGNRIMSKMYQNKMK